ncbi:MAG: 4-hydroxybutyrate CoA-transferase [Anaerolineaceae bacterium 4572_78]|nr:MAG: 4-hydroxybutyrate CoA-transferase [Anaerolineaceae bacterium 4572_78]
MKSPVTAEKAVEIICSNDRVFIHSIAASPLQLIRAMTERADELRNVEIVHLHTEGAAPYADEKYEGIFHINVPFIGSNIREAINAQRADYIPVFLSEVPALFRKGILPLDVALIQVSPPDKHGFCSLGTSVDATRAAVHVARYVVAQINPNMPRTHGDGIIHVNQIDAVIEVDDPLPELKPHKLTSVEMAISKQVTKLIEDGATLQMGIGAIPDAVLGQLENHKDLGIHSEMISDGIIDLALKGVINGSKKQVHPQKILASLALGSRRLYDFLDDNPQIVMLDAAYVNDTSVICRNPKVTAINGAIEVDLTGQVCADSIGTQMYSGVGGQMDFIRGASLSEGGKPIIALPSITKKGESRLVPYLKLGAGVVTTRAHVHYIVTEHGIADLYGKNLRQRAKALINIAHPDHQEWLEKEWFSN